MPARFASVALAVLMLAIPCAAASAAHLPSLFGSTGYAVRPASILLAPDGSVIFAGANGLSSHLRWSRWTHGVAIGHGDLYENNCLPSCARGTFAGYLGSVRGFRVRGDRFTRLSVTYKKHGRTITRTGQLFDLGASGRGWRFSQLFT